MSLKNPTDTLTEFFAEVVKLVEAKWLTSSVQEGAKAVLASVRTFEGNEISAIPQALFTVGSIVDITTQNSIVRFMVRDSPSGDEIPVTLLRYDNHLWEQKPLPQGISLWQEGHMTLEKTAYGSHINGMMESSLVDMIEIHFLGDTFENR